MFIADFLKSPKEDTLKLYLLMSKFPFNVSPLVLLSFFSTSFGRFDKKFVLDEKFTSTSVSLFWT